MMSNSLCLEERWAVQVGKLLQQLEDLAGCPVLLGALRASSHLDLVMECSSLTK